MTSTKRLIVLISGANSGIGLATATALVRDHGYHVIIGSRDASAGEQVAAELVAKGHSASSVQLDITSDESIGAAVRQIAHDFGGVLDVLINNAGIMIDDVPGGYESAKGVATRERFRRTFETNVFGAACLTEACAPLLRKSRNARLVFVSTRMASLYESTVKTNPWYPANFIAYDSSKAAFNMLALNWARILEEDGVMVNVVCPGLVKTKLTNNHPYGTSAEVGAKRVVELAIAEKGGPSFTWTDINGTVPW